MAKDMSGILFKNYNITSEKSPLYKGSATINDVKYWMAAWINDGDKGKYMSIKFEVAEEKEKPKQTSKKMEDMESDIPW